MSKSDTLPAGRLRGRAALAGLTVLVAVCVLAAHWGALEAGALCFDDNQYLLDNVLVRNPSWASVGRFLGEVGAPSTVRGYYQPLAMISLMVDYALGARAEQPRIFHATSLALHVANTMLIVVLLHGLVGSSVVAAMAGLLFGLHPMTVEPVPWIAERKTLLATFFALWMLILYVRHARGGRLWVYWMALAMFVLSLMSKPTGALLSLCLVGLDVWPLRRVGRRTLLEKVPFLVLTAASVVITVISQGNTARMSMPEANSVARIVLSVCHNVVFYLSKMLWPVNLTPHYPRPEPLALAHPAVFAGVVGTLLLLAVLLVAAKWTRAPLVGAGIFLVILAPTMGAITFTAVLTSDKYAYLPSVGLLILIAAGGSWLWRRARPGRRRLWISLAVAAVAVALAAGEAAATRRQYRLWRDTETLYRHMLALAPGSTYVLPDLANELVRQGRFDQAAALYRRAIELNPPAHQMARFYYNLGICTYRAGDVDSAIEHVRRALELQPQYARAHNAMGMLLGQKGLYEEALGHCRRAVALAGELVEARSNLAGMLLRLGRRDEAAAEYATVLRILPGYTDAHVGLGIALACEGRIDAAVEHYRWGVPALTRVEAMRRLAWLLATDANAALRNGPAAVEFARRACDQTQYQDAQCLDALAAAYAETGSFELAVQTARKAAALAESKGDRNLSREISARLAAYVVGRPHRAASQ